MATLQLAKKDLRRQVKHMLADLSHEAITSQSGTLPDQSSWYNYAEIEFLAQTVTKALFELAEFEDARSISVYCSMPSGEVSTAPIIYESLTQGKKIFVPYTHKTPSPAPGEPKSVMDMLSLKSRQDYEALQPDSWGIPTPSKDSIIEREACLRELEGSAGASADGLDMVIMPGMAFDVSLRRLGHGKGFYDYFLQRYHHALGDYGGTMPMLVGMALKEQVLADQDIPTNETDWSLDALIVGDGRILRRRQAI